VKKKATIEVKKKSKRGEKAKREESSKEGVGRGVMGQKKRLGNQRRQKSPESPGKKERWFLQVNATTGGDGKGKGVRQDGRAGGSRKGAGREEVEGHQV